MTGSHSVRERREHALVGARPPLSCVPGSEALSGLLLCLSFGTALGVRKEPPLGMRLAYRDAGLHSVLLPCGCCHYPRLWLLMPPADGLAWSSWQCSSCSQSVKPAEHGVTSLHSHVM